MTALEGTNRPDHYLLGDVLEEIDLQILAAVVVLDGRLRGNLPQVVEQGLVRGTFVDDWSGIEPKRRDELEGLLHRGGGPPEPDREAADVSLRAVGDALLNLRTIPLPERDHIRRARPFREGQETPQLALEIVLDCHS